MESCLLNPHIYRNLQGSYDHPEVVDEYLHAEILQGRVVGPFPMDSLPGSHISRFGVIPKGHQTNKWRLIVDLSYPRGFSVNDGIPKFLCLMKHISIDDAINEILKLGPGTLLAKIDIKNAFRLIPVHAADRQLLTMEWKGSLFVDTCLPFGLRSAPRLFNILANLAAWVMRQQGVLCLIHYLDDILMMGPPGLDTRQHNLKIIITVCTTLGIPLTSEKVEGPLTTLIFLGIILDTETMEAHLLEDKLQRTQQMVKDWLVKKNATKREIILLVGVLQHAAGVVLPGRSFVSRMYATAAKVKESDYFTRLNKDFRSDLYWWHTFLMSWNGRSLLKWH